MPRPLWVKPSRLGSSVGISRVLSPESELDDAVELAAAHDPRVIIEADARRPRGRVLGDRQRRARRRRRRVETSLPGEIVTKASEWYDFEAKYDEGGMELLVPAPIGDDGDRAGPRARRARLPAIAGTGLARCDFFVRDDGEVLVNEINTIPGFTETSVFGKLFEATGSPTPSSATGSSSSPSSATSASAASASSPDGPSPLLRCAGLPHRWLSATVLCMSMSLDGFIAGPNEGPDNGLGDGGHRLHEWALIGADGDHKGVGRLPAPTARSGTSSWPPGRLSPAEGRSSRRADGAATTTTACRSSSSAASEPGVDVGEVAAGHLRERRRRAR